MRIYHPHISTRYYDVKPSAFTRLDSIVYNCFDTTKSEVLFLRDYSKLIPKDWKGGLRTFKNFVVVPIVGFAMTSIMTAALPFTIAIDVIVGIVECILCKHRGFSNTDILKIAHCKMIASPIQQLAFGSVMVVANKIAGLVSVIFKGAYFWPITHPSAEILVNKLPAYFNPPDFTIFAKSGMIHDSKTNEWNAFIERQATLIAEVEELREAMFKNEEKKDPFKPNESYQIFKVKVLQHASPDDLLNLYNLSDLPKKHRKLGLALHPDKNVQNQAESEILFDILNRAKDILAPQTFVDQLTDPVHL